MALDPGFENFDELVKLWMSQLQRMTEQAYLSTLSGEAPLEVDPFVGLKEFITRSLDNKEPLRVLELGAGSSSLVDQIQSKNLLEINSLDLLDWSEVAAELLRQKQLERIDNYQFLTLDFTSREQMASLISQGKKYDLIVDAHLLHTISQISGLREVYWEHVSKLLSPGAMFFAEHMLCYGRISVNEGHRYESDTFDLWREAQDIEEVDLPIRHIPRSEKLEKELRRQKIKGLELKKFRIETSEKVIPFVSRREVSSDDPFISRFLIKKI